MELLDDGGSDGAPQLDRQRDTDGDVADAGAEGRDWRKQSETGCVCACVLKATSKRSSVEPE